MNIAQFDTQITHAVYTLPHVPLLDGLFQFFSAGGIFVIVWAVLFAYVITIEENRHPTFIMSFLSSTLSSAILTNSMLKNVIQRPRPLSPEAHPSLTLLISAPSNYPSDYSFPSGHATFAFTAAYILAKYDPKRAPIFYLIAILTAFSRVYLGYHYVSDVLVGSGIGLLAGWLTLYILDRKFLIPHRHD